jgi:hypothetical protein
MENINDNNVRVNAIEKTEELIKTKQPNNFLLENLKIKQNNYIEGNWKESVDYHLPQKVMKMDTLENGKLSEFLEKPIELNIKGNFDNFKI